MDAELTQLARTLVDPEKSVRDDGISKFTKYANKLKDVTDLHMLKLWKALYYCLWLTDKDHIQREVSSMITKLLHAFKTSELKVLYVKTFYVTILREWSLVDQYRANKLYVLMRLMLSELFDTIVAADFDTNVVTGYVSALEQNALCKTPNGVRFHVADIFLEELSKSTNGNISSMNFVALIQPFLSAINNDPDASYKDRVTRRIFTLFLSDYASENKGKNEGVIVFRKVNTKLLQAMVFELASSDGDDVSESARKRLYAIHREFQSVTKEEFIDVATALAQTKDKKTDKKDKSNKAKLEKMAVVEQPVAVPVSTKKIAKSAAAADEPKATPKTNKKRAQAEAEAEATEPIVEKSAKKVKKIATEVVDKTATVSFEKAVKEKSAKEKEKEAKAAAEKSKAKTTATAEAEKNKAKAVLQSVTGVKASAKVVNGVTIEVTKQVDGAAKAASNGKRVKMHYTGKLRNGKIFDSSIGKKPFVFRLGAGEVIRGWDIGISGMKVGEKRILTIPPEKGYGRQGSPPVIPGNATLIFEVQCLDIN